MGKQPHAWTTPAQLIEHFQISTQTVLNKIHSGEWECTKLSTRIYRFSESQVDKIENGVTAPPARSRDRSAMKDALRKLKGA